MRLKLSEKNRYVLELCLREQQGVLREIKHRPLTGKSIEQMKMLEESVSNLQSMLLSTAIG